MSRSGERWGCLDRDKEIEVVSSARDFQYLIRRDGGLGVKGSDGADAGVSFVEARVEI